MRLPTPGTLPPASGGIPSHVPAESSVSS